MHTSLLQRILLLMVCAIGTLLGHAQNIEVVGEITEDPGDQTANTAPIIKDLNDKPCAVIKIETTQKGIIFDIGTSTSIVKVEQQNDKHPAEVWLWVPAGTRQLNMQHAQLGKKKYSFPSLRTMSNKTYLMKLSTGKVETIVHETQHQQFLKLRVIPKTASVTIDGTSYMLDEHGMVSPFLEFGVHEINATASNYHPYAARYTINDPDKAQELTIQMKPAFGWITVKDSTGIAGARVLIDDEEVGIIPVGGEGLRSQPLRSGQHRVRVERKLYTPFTTTVTVTDSLNAIIFPRLEANFATTKIICDDPEADIYINKEKRGRGTWSGPLEVGSYQFEAQRPYHRSTSRSFNITKKNMGDDITLSAPTPINGSLRISSNPLDVAVEIDGKAEGSTPLFKNSILIGPHKLRFTRSGYTPLEMTVEVAATGTTEINPTMSNECSFKVIANVEDAAITVRNAEGKTIASGTTPLDIDSVSVGNYTFELKKDGYADLKETIECKGSDVRLTMKATRKTVKIRSNSYISPYYTYLDGKAPLASTRKGDRLYEFDLDYGVHTFKIDTKRSKASQTFRVNDNSKNEIYVRQHYQYIVKNMFYIDLGAECLGGATLVGGGMGFNAGNVNLEGTGFYPVSGNKKEFYMTRKEESNYNYDNPSLTKIEEVYVAGGRIGYAIKLFNRMQITPQFGVDYHAFKFGDDDNSAYALSGTGGARIFCGLTKHIGLQVSPQYRFPLKQAKDYKALADTFKEVKDWTEGFNIRAALVFFW